MTSSQARREKKRLEKLQRAASTEDPFFEFDFPPAYLLSFGPIIVTGLGVTESHATALKDAGLPVPAVLKCRFLIDTGADGCMVKHEIAEKCGLKLISANVPVHGVGVDTTGRMYMGRIYFRVPSRKVSGLAHDIVVDTQIASGGLPSDHLDGLIGRNLLDQFDFRYNGKTGKVTMRFLRRAD